MREVTHIRRLSILGRLINKGGYHLRVVTHIREVAHIREESHTREGSHADEAATSRTLPI